MTLSATLAPLLLLLMAASVRGKGLPGETPGLPHEKYVLPNGMKVILHEDHSLPVAAVNVWYDVGSKDEPKGRSGFAHLFEHLMFMGTERVPGSQFDVLMERSGGANNATTSFDRTNYYASGPASMLPTLLWLEADRLEDLGRMMNQDKLDKQRDVVRNERRQSYENRPYGRADLVVNEELFPPGHPYHIHVIGSHEDLQAATVQDVQQFFETYYVPGNASLVVAGDFEPAEIKPLIERLFGTLPTRPMPPRLPAPPPVALPGVKRLTLSDAVQLSRITIAWPSPALYQPGDADMDVIAGILAQGRSSRLWRRLVRDEKLCAEVMAYQGSRRLASAFEIEALCPPETDLDRVEQVIDEEIRRFQAEGPDEGELRRLRNQIEHGMLMRLESLQDRADQLNAYENARGEPDSLRWDLARYDAVSAATTRRAAREVLNLDARLIVRVLTASPRASQPAPLPARSFAFPMPETWRLPNGLTVYHWFRPQLPLMSTRLIVPRGAASDPQGKAGLVQISLDMLDEGTSRMTAPEFADALEILGAHMHVAARREGSTLALRATSATFAEALGLFSEAILTPALAPAEWQRVLDLHRQDLQARDDDPSQVAPLVASRRLFGAEHPLGSPVDGDLVSIEALGLDDVKAMLPRLLRPDHATLLVAGAVDRAGVERLVAEKFGAWQPSGDPAPMPVIEPPRRTGLEVALVHRPGAVQTNIRFAWPAPGMTDPDRVPLDLLNTILGGSFTSRLNQNLREEHGYTYGASSRFVLLPSIGVASAQSSVRADVSGASIGEFLKELDRGQAGGITADEHAKAAATVRNRRVDATSGLAGLLDQAEEMLSARLPFSEIDRALASLDGIGPADLDAVAARRIQHRQGVLVLVGDRDVILPQLAGLGLPEPIEVDLLARPVTPQR